MFKGVFSGRRHELFSERQAPTTKQFYIAEAVGIHFLGHVEDVVDLIGVPRQKLFALVRLHLVRTVEVCGRPFSDVRLVSAGVE